RMVAFAGPAMNLSLAAACVLLSAIWGGYCQFVPAPLWANVLVFLSTGAFLNVVLAFLNLLPVPPLDGSRILASFSPQFRQLLAHPHAPIVGLVVLLLIFGQFGSFVFGPARRLTHETIALVHGALPGARPMFQSHPQGG